MEKYYPSIPLLKLFKKIKIKIKTLKIKRFSIILFLYGKYKMDSGNIILIFAGNHHFNYRLN